MQVVRPRIRNAKPVPRIYSGASGVFARAVDSVIGLVAPGAATRMRRKRMESAAMLAYEAAQVDRMMPRERIASADSEVLPNLEVMRARSRRQVQNDSHADSAVQVYVDAVVGPGIKPQSSATVEATGASQEVVDEWRKSCEAYFEDWSETMADSSGHGNFYELQALVARTRKVDGECFTHTVIGGDQTLSVEVIDADRVTNPDRRRDDENLRSGIVVDAKMMPVGYYVASTHPNDLGRKSDTGFAFVPAREGELSVMQHHYRRTRPGQTRGYPDNASAAQYLEHLHEYLKAEIIGARASANYAMFIKKAVNASDQEIMPVIDSIDGQNDTVYHERLEAGTIAYLNEGEEPVPFNPNRPGAADSFVVRMLRAIAASNGMSYERMTRDYGGMNYSSMRGLLKEEQRGFDRDRAMLVRQFCVPVWHNVIRHGIQTGALTPPPQYLDNPRAWLAVYWIPPAMGWVDPTKEIAAAEAAIEANLSTHWHEAGRAGLDPVEVLERKADYFKKAAQIEEQQGLQPGTLTGADVLQREGDADQGNPDELRVEGSDSASVSSSQPDAKAMLDAIGTAIRGGLISPQQVDEAAVREMLGLPPMSTDVNATWQQEPVRRPVTLTKPESAEAADGAAAETPEDTDGTPFPAGDEEPGEAEEQNEAEEELAAEGYDPELLATYQPPKGAQNNARKVLKWKREHGDEVKGMTSVGWARARQLAAGRPISADTVKKMAQFNRHRENAKVAPENRNTPWKDNGYVAWLGWGGTTGINWARRISEGLD